MVTRSTSAQKNEPHVHNGCERCTQLEEIRTDLYEALATMTRAFTSFAKVVNLDETIETGRPGERAAAEGVRAVINKGIDALAKARGEVVN